MMPFPIHRPFLRSLPVDCNLTLSASNASLLCLKIARANATDTVPDVFDKLGGEHSLAGFQNDCFVLCRSPSIETKSVWFSRFLACTLTYIQRELLYSSERAQ